MLKWPQQKKGFFVFIDNHRPVPVSATNLTFRGGLLGPRRAFLFD